MQYAISKLYYSIAEVAKIIGEEQHVLRYWEREFVQLRPQKNRSGNRTYTKRDLAVLRVIKHLLRDERYTVAGAREHLKIHGLPEDVEKEFVPAAVAEVEPTVASVRNSPEPDHAAVRQVVLELRSIATELRRKVAV